MRSGEMSQTPTPRADRVVLGERVAEVVGPGAAGELGERRPVALLEVVQRAPDGGGHLRNVARRTRASGSNSIATGRGGYAAGDAPGTLLSAVEPSSRSPAAPA